MAGYSVILVEEEEGSAFVSDYFRDIRSEEEIGLDYLKRLKTRFPRILT
jgi:hypothetical protein